MAVDRANESLRTSRGKVRDSRNRTNTRVIAMILVARIAMHIAGGTVIQRIRSDHSSHRSTSNSRNKHTVSAGDREPCAGRLGGTKENRSRAWTTRETSAFHV